LSRREIESLLPVLRANTAKFAEELVITLKNKAHLEMDEHKYAAAFEAATAGSKVATERLGPDHPEFVAAQLMVALTSQYQGDPRAALVYAHRALTLTQRRYAENRLHPRTIEAEFLLGRALGGAGRFVEAAAQMQLAVNHAAEVLGPSSRKVGFFLVELARFQLLAGDSHLALQSSEQALSIISQHVDHDSARYASVLAMRGKCLLAEHRVDEAMRDLQQATKIFEQNFGPGSEPAVSTRRGLALATLAGRESRVVVAQSPGY
jgi:tetratricopeptide (TPR) repeat protein